MKTKSYIAPLILMVLWAVLNPYKPVSSESASSETHVAASATESPTSTQPSDDGVPEVLTQVAEKAPKLEHRAEANAGAGAMHLEPPPSAAGPISYPVPAEAAATPIKVVSQPYRTTYGQYYACGQQGCSVVYPTRVQPQRYYQRRSVFRRW